MKDTVRKAVNCWATIISVGWRGCQIQPFLTLEEPRYSWKQVLLGKVCNTPSHFIHQYQQTSLVTLYSNICRPSIHTWMLMQIVWLLSSLAALPKLRAKALIDCWCAHIYSSRLTLTLKAAGHSLAHHSLSRWKASLLCGDAGEFWAAHSEQRLSRSLGSHTNKAFHLKNNNRTDLWKLCIKEES